MRRNHVLALLFVLAALSAALALTLVVPPASDVYGKWDLDNSLSRAAPAVAWERMDANTSAVRR